MEISKNNPAELDRMRAELRSANEELRLNSIEFDALRTQLAEAQARACLTEAVIADVEAALDSCRPEDFSTGHVIHQSHDEGLVEKALRALHTARTDLTTLIAQAKAEARAEERVEAEKRVGAVKCPQGRTPQLAHEWDMAIIEAMQAIRALPDTPPAKRTPEEIAAAIEARFAEQLQPFCKDLFDTPQTEQEGGAK